MFYLSHLDACLAPGVGRVPHEIRDRQADYLRAAQRPDGGFAGRLGGSDLYYTGFGLRGLALLGQLDPDVIGPAARFLQRHLARATEVVELASAIQAAMALHAAAGVDVLSTCDAGWRGRVAGDFERLRRADGGYARSPDGAASSMYQTFLVAVSLPPIGRPLVDPERLVRFTLGQRREDGGFVEIRSMKQGGTNPTAAAIAVLCMAGGLDRRLRETAAGFLTHMQNGQGGMRANTRIAVADLLSTFTAVWTLTELDRLGAIDQAAAREFVRSLMRPGGGFRGAAWDLDCDVEYTYYGLATLALLADGVNH